MSTERRTDQGDYIEVVVGEPTWDDPSEWGYSLAEPKPGTPQANASIVDQAITDALNQLQNLANAAALPTVPAGTMTTAQLSSAMRTLRDEAQATRAGAQQVARTLRQTIRLVRGDFDDID